MKAYYLKLRLEDYEMMEDPIYLSYDDAKLALEDYIEQDEFMWDTEWEKISDTQYSTKYHDDYGDTEYKIILIEETEIHEDRKKCQNYCAICKENKDNKDDKDEN